jgi:hypothetical protein
MANLYISVTQATISNGTNQADVTSSVQAVFDQQFSRSGFDPSSGFTINVQSINPPFINANSLGIAYEILQVEGNQTLFTAGGSDSSITIKVLPIPLWNVVSAVYAGTKFGIDIAKKLQTFLDDPRNANAASSKDWSFVIGSPAFLNAFTGGRDPEGGVTKCVSICLEELSSNTYVKICGFDGQTIDLSDQPVLRNRDWMSRVLKNNTDTSLSDICFPATHDTGTYALQQRMTPQPIKEWYSFSKYFSNIQDNWPVLLPFFPLTALEKLGTHSLMPYATATSRSVLQQLQDGIRCLDLRLYFNQDDSNCPYYTAHGFMGVSLAAILMDIAYFIEIDSPNGEIVYITAGHGYRDSGPFTNTDFQNVCNMVLNQIGTTNLVSTGSSLFSMTYQYVVGTTPSSKVIFVAELGGIAGIANTTVTAPNVSGVYSQYFWQCSDYSPPDNTSNNIIYGSYTDTDQLNDMVSDQQKKSRLAASLNQPFALYLTLTPTTGAIMAMLTRNAIAPSVALFGALFHFVWPPLAIPLLAVAAVMAVYGSIAVTYKSLKQLTAKVFSNSGSGNSNVKLCMSQFTGEGYAVPAFIYMDYYEEYFVTLTNGEVANRQVAQLVEEAKTSTRSRF